MPCNSVSARVVMSTKLKNANQAMLAQAFKLMHEVVTVELQGTDSMRVVTKNGTVYVDIKKDTVTLVGQMGRVLEPKLADHYMAAIQVALLKKKGMQVQVQNKDDRIRIVAE